MDWNGQSVIAIATLIVTQAGILIWRLAMIQSKLTEVCKEVGEIPDLEHRLTELETRCELRHKE